MAAALLIFLLIFLAGGLAGYGLRSYVSRQRRWRKRRASYFQDGRNDTVRVPSRDPLADPPSSSDAVHNLQA